MNRVKQNLPIITALSGLLLFIIGAIIPHVGYTQPGTNWLWSAGQTNRNCTDVHQTLGYPTSALAMCSTAKGVLEITGALILLGFGAIITAAVIGIRRRLRNRPSGAHRVTA